MRTYYLRLLNRELTTPVCLMGMKWNEVRWSEMHSRVEMVRVGFWLEIVSSHNLLSPLYFREEEWI
jgi:hypothetical protein